MSALTVRVEGRVPEGTEIGVGGQRIGLAGGSSVRLDLPPGEHFYEVLVGGRSYLSGTVSVAEGRESVLVVEVGGPLVVVDTREASGCPRIARALAESGCVVREEKLDAGDYYCPPFLVERKSVTDFVHSVRDGRLWRELGGMKASSARPVLLVEGPLSLLERFTGWSPSSVCGLLLSVADGWGVPVLWSPSPPWTVAYLLSMARRGTREDRERPLRRAEKPADPREAALAVVEALPGVGPGRARALLGRFGSLAALFSASAGELEGVEGVGRKTAARLEALFRLRWEDSRKGI